MSYDKKFREERNECKAVMSGIVMTISLHLCAVLLVGGNGLKYIYPPPEEKSLLIDFSEEETELIEQKQSERVPSSEEINLNEAVRLSQKSESPVESKTENLTPESKMDDFGDVDVPAPKEEKEELDPRAAFPGMAKKDTNITAPHSSINQEDENFKAGQPNGNTSFGSADTKPNAHVKGRKVIDGNIPRPEYNVQESGVVVVTIWVDNYGNVVRAVPGGDGTTVLNKSLYTAARNAAMNTHFNQSAEAPAMQEGTITYYFNLK